MRIAAPAFEILMLAPVRRFFPEPRQLLNGSWRCSRVCTPPRISPSCPHYVPLWLGRSTIVCGQDHCEAACQSCFWMDGYASLLASAENLRQEYDRLLTWADLFDTCSFEAKKMIVAQFVKAVRVSRDYNSEIDFNVSFEEFQNFSVKNGEPVILQPLRSHTA